MAEKEDTGGVRLRRQSDQKIRDMSRDLEELKEDFKDLRRIVVGDDGSNGIRGDVAEIKEALHIAAAERQTLIKIAKVVGVGIGALIPIWDILFKTVLKPLFK